MLTKADKRAADAERKWVALRVMERERHDAQETERGRLETIALRVRRQDHIDGGDNGRVAIVRDGLHWLMMKGHVSPRQYDAGKRYGDDYRLCDVTVKSCLAALDRVDCSSRDGGNNERERASWRLREARLDGLKDQTKLITLCNLVCGQGRAVIHLVHGDDREAQKLIGTLYAALDLLVTHYGL
jgi:hypothetical protein